MAKKRSIQENSPSSPASEEEEANDSEEESTDDYDQQGKAPLASQGRKAFVFPVTVSDSDYESESSSDSSSASASAFQFKPVTPNRIKKPTQTSIDAEAATAAAKKKSADAEEEEEEGDEGRKGSQRRWSEDDEITLLNRMIQYKSEKGSDASSDWGVFVDYIRKSLQNQVSKSSLITKVRRLKQKYLSVKCKSDDPLFSKPYEKKFFELSKKIWGSNGGKSEKEKNKSKSSSKVGNIGSSGGVTLALANPEFTSSLAPSAKKSKRVSNREMSGDKKEKEKNLGNEEVKRVLPKVEEMEKGFSQKYPCLFASMKGKSVEEVFMNEVGKIEEAKLKEWESRWVKLQRSELQLFVQQSLLINEQVKEVLDILKS